MMEHIATGIDGLLVLRPRIFRDQRGNFFESFNDAAFKRLTGTENGFVQDNESCSAKHVLRGLHYQVAPHEQGKFVHVVKGSVLDVCLDIRLDSGTFGKHFSMELNSEHKEMLWIPPGFAHGFVALEPDTVFAYKCTSYYHPASERTIRWNDPDLAIDWGVEQPLISDKDAQGISFRTFNELQVR